MFARRSDEEHVERLRRTMATFDRWRRLLIVWHLALAIAFIGLIVAFSVLFHDVGRNLGVNVLGLGPGFIAGLAVGASLGMTAIHIGHKLVDLLLGYRNERLLIRYYDASRKPREEGEREARSRRFQVALYPSDEGVAVRVPSLPGCWSEGATEEEALANVAVAIREYLETEDELAEGAELSEVEVFI